MKYGRADYDSPAGPQIGAEEPVFLLRAQDKLAPTIVRDWAARATAHGADPLTVRAALAQAAAMDAWQAEHGKKLPNMPASGAAMAEIAMPQGLRKDGGAVGSSGLGQRPAPDAFAEPEPKKE